MAMRQLGLLGNFPVFEYALKIAEYLDMTLMVVNDLNIREDKLRQIKRSWTCNLF